MRILTAALLASSGSVLASQPSAPAAQPGEIRDLVWGDLNFLHTSDTHGWHAGHLQESQYSADWGDYLSFTKHMRAKADEKGVDLIVLDTGDRIEGNGLSDASEPKGVYVREIFKTVPLDLVTIGNHELYKERSSEGEVEQMVPYYNGRYITSNVFIKSDKTGKMELIGAPFAKFTTKNKGYRILALGVLFDFERYNAKTYVQKAADLVRESWFKEAIADQELDMVLIYGHTPVRDSPEFDLLFKTIRKAQGKNFPIQFFGGHTHIRDFSVYDEWSTGLEPGRYCESVGWLSINGLKKGHEEQSLEYSRRYIDFNRYGFQHHSGTDEKSFDTEQGKSVSVMIGKIRKVLNLDEKFGCAPRDFFMFREPLGSKASLFNLLNEEVLPKMVVNEKRKDIPRYIYINTGAMRFDIFKGPFTYDTSFIVSPFMSYFKYIPNVKRTHAHFLQKIFNKQKTFAASLAAFKDLASPESTFYPKKLKDESFSILGGKGTQQQLDAEPERKRTPGYTTFDDVGSDGDDTVHSPLPFYEVGNTLRANASFPKTGVEEVETVDLVFLDFIQPYVILALNFLTFGKYSDGDVEVYMSEEDTLTKLMLEYAKREWGQDC